jgi:hypothetical protein
MPDVPSRCRMTTIRRISEAVGGFDAALRLDAGSRTVLQSKNVRARMAGRNGMARSTGTIDCAAV